MPYKSVAQRKYLHAKEPALAAKWDKKYGGKVKKSKGEGWLKPVLAGTVAGGLANQFPRVQDVERHHRKKKKGRVQKFAYEDYVHSEDPDFNHQAARKAFDLVMKMDDDSAEMFTHIVVSDLFEETIEKNHRTLQRHLNEVIAKRLADWKLATTRLVAKGYDPKTAVAYAHAIDEIETLISKSPNPYDYGYQWKESDFRRDPSSGRFRTKITQQQKKELPKKLGEQMLGVKTPDKTSDGRDLSPEDKVRFQDEYRQLAGFLSSVNESSGSKGNQSVMLHMRDVADGSTWSQLHFGKKPPVDLLADPNFRLVGAEAKPDALTAGGAAFGLATALGGGMSPSQIKGVNAADQGSTQFVDDWLQAGDPTGKATNQKLYNRMAGSGKFLQQVAPGSPKAQIAGQFAQIVGNHGPEAEAVLGPSARKTAYRYRGTEKTPEKQLVNAYGDAIQAGKKYTVPDEEEQFRVGAGRGTSHGSMVAAGARTKGGMPLPKEKGGSVPLHRQAAANQALADRAPDWHERDLGRQTVVAFLRQKTRAPKQGLYGLQLAAGNTPPSEGVIINADGQIASQAVGYGDDHYLPFNLKNLKSLKGGEYIRTRSVGGLTSEDIYTGLISGARQVTVTSRSGTYTMTYEPDFRGGRRHNDKARRMTRRYEQLLDAVQSQQVERGDIDPLMREEIEREVKEEMPTSAGSAWRRSDQMEEIKDRIDEFKQNPYISDKDELRATVIINSRAAGASEAERAKIKAQVYDEMLEQKETTFRLNSEGYKAAMEALAEQFPYYVKVRYTPPKDVEGRIATEHDKGYVEPGRNRPTAATAGLYGTVKGKSGKFSAAQADYQGVRAVARGGSANVGTGHLEARTDETGNEIPGSGSKDDVHRKRAKENAKFEQDESVVKTAKELQELAKGPTGLNEVSLQEKDIKAAVEMTEEDLKDPRNMERFASWANAYVKLTNFPDNDLKRRWESAIGSRDRKPFIKGSTNYPKYPPTFEGEDAYEPGAEPREVAKEIHKVNRESKGSVVSNGTFYSDMSDKEWEDEHTALAKMHRNLTSDPTPLDHSDLKDAGVDPSSPALKKGKNDLRSSTKAIERQMELLQRTRALMSGLSDEQRKKVVEATSKIQVIHGTPTSEQQKKPKQNVDQQIKWGQNVLTELEDLRGQLNAKLGEPKLTDSHREAIVLAMHELPDEEMTEKAMNVVETMDNNRDDLRTDEDYGAFLAANKDDLDALVTADGILNTKRDHLHVLLNPPKRAGS
jgi:hypothetical protein